MLGTVLGNCHRRTWTGHICQYRMTHVVSHCPPGERGRGKPSVLCLFKIQLSLEHILSPSALPATTCLWKAWGAPQAPLGGLSAATWWPHLGHVASTEPQPGDSLRGSRGRSQGTSSRARSGRAARLFPVASDERAGGADTLRIAHGSMDPAGARCGPTWFHTERNHLPLLPSVSGTRRPRQGDTGCERAGYTRLELEHRMPRQGSTVDMAGVRHGTLSGGGSTAQW